MPQRKSNVELMRIFSMFLIILYHAAFHSGFPTLPSRLTGNMMVVKILWFFGELGVNLFILTTGYFQVLGRFKWRKLLLLLVQVQFYSWLVEFIGLYVGAEEAKTPLIFIFMPVSMKRYWFVTAYIIVYLFSPYMKVFIDAMDKKMFQRFLLTSLILYSVIPTLLGFLEYDSNTEVWLYFNRMIWLLIMYSVGAYIRLYSLPLLRSMKYALLCALGSFALMTNSILVIYELDTVFYRSIEIAYWWRPNTVLMVLLSVGIFCVFLQLNVPYSPWINRVASTTFGIYLLHDNKILRNWFWKTFIRLAEQLDTPTLIPQIFAVSAGIFLVGMTIDFARQAIERVTLKKWLSSEHFLRFETRFDVNPTKRKL